MPGVRPFCESQRCMLSALLEDVCLCVCVSEKMRACGVVSESFCSNAALSLPVVKSRCPRRRRSIVIVTIFVADVRSRSNEEVITLY